MWWRFKQWGQCSQQCERKLPVLASSSKQGEKDLASRPQVYRVPEERLAPLWVWPTVDFSWCCWLCLSPSKLLLLMGGIVGIGLWHTQASHFVSLKEHQGGHCYESEYVSREEGKEGISYNLMPKQEKARGWGGMFWKVSLHCALARIRSPTASNTMPHRIEWKGSGKCSRTFFKPQTNLKVWIENSQT